MMKRAAGLLAVMFSFPVFAKNPDCTGVENWPAMIAYGELKNAGIIDSHTLDLDKTRVIRFASSKKGRVPYAKISANLYRQAHRVTFVKKSGEPITVITVSDASHYECSMSGVDVYVVSKPFGIILPVSTRNPDCTDLERGQIIERSLAKVVESDIVDTGIAGRDTLDSDKTEVIGIVSENIGKDRYRWVHRATFVKKTGELLPVITVSNVSHNKCSVSDVDLYTVSMFSGDTVAGGWRWWQTLQADPTVHFRQ